MLHVRRSTGAGAPAVVHHAGEPPLEALQVLQVLRVDRREGRRGRAGAAAAVLGPHDLPELQQALQLLRIGGEGGPPALLRDLNIGQGKTLNRQLKKQFSPGQVSPNTGEGKILPGKINFGRNSAREKFCPRA